MASRRLLLSHRLFPHRIYRSSRCNYTTQLPRNVIEELTDRGFISAVTCPALTTHVNSPTCVYAGIDPSAPSLHVGNLLPLMGLLHFKAAGHQAITLIGGATGSIGDPSGKSSERPLLPSTQLEENVKSITAQVNRFFSLGQVYVDSHGGYPTSENSYGQSFGRKGELKVLNNLEWFKNVPLLDFLRDVGKLAKLNTMLSRESVKNRRNTDSGMSFTEFSYQLLQAHDFAVLHGKHGCNVQLGGSDQWGNIVAGIHLIKRQRAEQTGQVEPSPKGETQIPGGRNIEVEEEAADDKVFGLTTPLLTAANGEKFGKSAGNAIWLDPGRTSESDFYQFFYRTTDDSVDQYLKLFTLVPLERIKEVMDYHLRSDRRRERSAQTLLADEVTRLVHGADAVRRAHLIQDILYRQAPRSLRSESVLDAFSSDPRLRRVKWSEIRGVPVTKLAVVYGICKARSEATQAIKHRAIKVNDRVILDPRGEISRSDFVDKHIVIFRVGGKQQLVFYIEEA